ncbi:MAG: hypothetical protein AB1567_05155 [bacterium]
MEIRRGKHHDHAYYFTVKDRQVVRTRVSHGKGDIPMPAFYQILHQFHLNVEQFIQLKDCPLDIQGYLKILKSKKIINNGGG